MRNTITLTALAIAILAGCTLAGCAAQVPADPTKMTAEQINALAKDKSASAACTIINSPWGVGRTIWVQLDKSTFKEGSVTVNAECGVTVNSTTPVLVAPVVAPKAP